MTEPCLLLIRLFTIFADILSHCRKQYHIHKNIMTLKQILSIPAVLHLLVAASVASAAEAKGPESVIPAPVYYEITGGSFSLSEGLSFHIEAPDSAPGFDELEAELFSDGFVRAPKKSAADIRISVGDRRSRAASGQNAVPYGPSSWKDTGAESYALEVRPDKVLIEAPSFAGAFYALQTLLQMGPDVKCCKVTDRPGFGYRGLHFDVSRHFRPKDFLMKQMDAMALLKLNKMHLHLTDGAGWRIEIDGYPRLTDFAAWRPYRKWSDWWTSDRHYCEKDAPGAYGGYYTAQDIREILEYAREKHIDVIPEIEMPGHSEEVLAAYPELSCTGEQYGSSDFCPGKEETFTFLEAVLTEVMEMFPSEYIHIGGDEAGKGTWKTCPDCRRRMQQEGLADVDELQSYLIHRIEAFVNSKGRKIIGWDEILQGGLAPNATVMSWRGTEGGITAIESGHDVIMTPGAYCYLDYTQDAPFKEPVSIGGYIPLAKTYSYEPVEPGLSDEEVSHLLGVQGNLWSEYIPDDSHAEYMYYPRAYAIAEIGWNPGKEKDYPDFRERALMMNERLGSMGYTVFDLAGEYGDRKESASVLEHIGKDSKVEYSIPWSSQYPAAGETTLTDGVIGGWTYGDMKWQGFMTDMDVTVDLGSVRPVRYIGATFMQIASAWVWLPEKVEISVSDDGETFRPAGTVWKDLSDKADGLFFKPYGIICDENCRYVRVHAVKYPLDGAWLFTDEIVVN